VQSVRQAHEGKLWYHMIGSNCGISLHPSVEFASTIVEDVVHVFKSEKSWMLNVLGDVSLDCRYRLVPPRLKLARSSLKRTIKSIVHTGFLIVDSLQFCYDWHSKSG
jgi:hypothetical protein